MTSVFSVRFQPIERVQHFADPVVGVRQHRGVDVVRFFEIAKTPPVLGHRVERRVRLVNPQVDEERLLRAMALLDEGDGVARVLVHRHLFAGAVEGAVLVVAVLARQRRIRDHVVREMPLAEVSRGIAACCRNLGSVGALGLSQSGMLRFALLGTQAKWPSML